MSNETVYLLAADAILVSHVLFVAFVVLGLMAIYVGHWASWAWVRNLRFRVLHLVAITIVVLQSWVGVICPLTTWEMQLRELAGARTYEGSFIQYWLHALLYYDAPGWVFVAAYTAFGGLVVASWFIVPPRRRRR
ncbi:MAG: DUF2784 domain-containing protein [Gammaproteobacteria bacterium]|nr:DUF2784 domain-containing protein [Gammaproteobacteria bacterium]